MMADSEKLYVQCPLVRWVETFKANDGHPLEYHDLFDGVFLNDVMQQIDTRTAYDSVNRFVEDVSVRLHNWDILVRNIRGFYSDVLQQLLVIRLPNISVICRDPGKDVSFAEVRKALLLILGCAVQCEQKETFIDKIMSMDITTQTEIVENIKEMTDTWETILPIQRPESPASSSAYIDKIFHHLYRLIRERDECLELTTELGQEHDNYLSQAEGRHIVDAPLISPDRHHIALELAECKANLRHLRQELEDRQEHLSDLKDELQESLVVCSQLKNENALLVQEARVTRLLQDELDIMKEKASKVDMYEKEILKYKEKLNEFEFYKARTGELKEDNAILEETKVMLEDQLASSRKRIEIVEELESELGRYRQQIKDLSRDRDSDREKIEFLTKENTRLEIQRKTSPSESFSLETEVSAARSGVDEIGYSLSEQLSETSHTRILRLELENQRLSAALAEEREKVLAQNTEMSIGFEKETQRLTKKIEQLQANVVKMSQQVVQLERELFATKEDRDTLLKALDSTNEKSEQHAHELEKEIEQLSQALQQLRERSEKSNDLKVKDLERENKRLHETLKAKSSQLNKLEFDNQQLQQSSHQLQELTHKVHDLEQECRSLEKENAELHQKVATLQLTADKLEVIELENSDRSTENRRLQKLVETLQATVQRREQLEEDHISLTVEHQRLQRLMEILKAGSDRAVELESEKDDLHKEIQQLKKLLEGQKSHKMKQEQMEFEIIDMGNENQHLQKSLEVTMRRLHQLEEDNMDLEADNEKINKELEALRVTMKRLEIRDTETSQLEVEVQELQKVKAALEKENRKLKQNYELKDSSLEDINTRFISLNQEYKSLRQSVEKMKVLCSKVKDLEVENRELLQELNTDRKTLAALREELVNEKIRSQDLSNELDQLTCELEKVGIDTEKLTIAERTKDANRYKALETMIEETLKKSSELKDEKIRALETRLEESKSRNLKLQEELIEAKRANEVLKQKLEEEELMVQDVIADKKNEGATKEILQLKDHLVELERQNATLLAETDNLRSNNHNVTEQCHKLETQICNLHSQHAVLQGHYSSLREQNAKLQVERTTLQAQANSAVSLQDMLKKQFSHLETEQENLTHKYEGLQSIHQSFISDHEALQKLHEQLTAEHELLVTEHSSLKSLHKSVKIEMKDLQDQVEVLSQHKTDANNLQDVIEKEIKQMLFGDLQSSYQTLQEDHQELKSAFDQLNRDYTDVLASNKQMKTDYNNLQLKTMELQEELIEAKENISIAEMEFEKLENKMETIYHINERIENENQALLMQIKQLLNQNQELLTKALNSKDHFAEEEKAYLEKLSELRRQKERLEEKIMENYKNRLSPKKKGLGALIARKARGIILRGPKHTKSRNNLSEVLENSSQESGSTEIANDIHQRLDAKSTEDINTSASNKDIHQTGLEGKTQGRISEAFDILTSKDISKSMLNVADSKNKDDSCFDEMLLKSRQCQVLHETKSASSEHFSQLHLPNSISQVQPNLSEVTTSSSISPAICEVSSLSVGSDSESSSIGSSGYRLYQVFTSTPKIESETTSLVMTHSSLESQLISSSHSDRSIKHLQRAIGVGEQTPSLGSQAPANRLCSQSTKLHHSLSHMPQLQINTYKKQGRELRPAPTYPPPPIPTAEFVNPLTILGSESDESTSVHYAQPYQSMSCASHVDHIWDREGRNLRKSSDNNRDSRGLPDLELNRRMSQISNGKTSHSHLTKFPSHLGKTQLGLSSDKLTQRLDNTNAPVHYRSSHRSPLNESRPASALGHSSHVRSFYTRPPDEIESRQNQPQQGKASGHGEWKGFNSEHKQADNNVNNSSSRYSQQCDEPFAAERPKSVPPHLFYRSGDRYDSKERHASPKQRNRDQVENVSTNNIREAPDGRGPRETQSVSNISLIRESVMSSSHSASQSQESQYSRQLQPHYDPQHQQQPHHKHNINNNHASLNSSRNIGSWRKSSPQVPSFQQDKTHSYFPQTSLHIASNQTDSKAGSVDQLSLHRLDSQSLAHLDGDSSGYGQLPDRQHHDPDFTRATSHQSLRRSQSSVGTNLSSSPSSATKLAKNSTSERQSLLIDLHNKDSQDQRFNHHHYPVDHQDGYPLGSSSDYRRDCCDTGGHINQLQGNNEPRETLTSFLSGGFSYSQQQQQQQQQPLNTSKQYNHSLSSISAPCHQNYCPESTQYNRSSGPSKTDNLSQEAGGPAGVSQSYQSQAVSQQCTSSQGKPSSNYVLHNIPSHEPAVDLSSFVNKSDLPTLNPGVSNVSKAPHVLPTLEREVEGGQATKKNSIWYEYGCV